MKRGAPLLIVAVVLLHAAGADILNFSTNPCPQVLGCQCLNSQLTDVECHSANEETLKQLAVFYKGVKRLQIRSWHSEDLNFDLFASFDRLSELRITHGEIENVNASRKLPRLLTLDLSFNAIYDSKQFCALFTSLPTLSSLDISHNYLTAFGNCSTAKWAVLHSLFLGSNQIISLMSLPKTLKNVDVPLNSLSNVNNISDSVNYLNASGNQIAEFEPRKFPNLLTLDLSGLKVRNFSVVAPQLKTLVLDKSELNVLSFSSIAAPKLLRFSFREAPALQVVSGVVPPTVQEFSLTDSLLTALPRGLFKHTSPTVLLDLSGNKWNCESCVISWTIPVLGKLAALRDACKIKLEAMKNCTLGISKDAIVQYGIYNKDSIVTCAAYGDPNPRVSWYRYRPSQYLGSYDPDSDVIDRKNVSDEAIKKYAILSGGGLLIRNPDRSSVERYVCVAQSEEKKIFELMYFRLDYRNWYSLDIFHSVFWGGFACGFLVCAISFLLNITWILTRKSIMWWILRAERLSRVRKMVEAMEKYRAKQMESLHDKYTKKVQIVRDNYHQQVEALRVSYSSQSDKFRDYRTAQMDAVTAHLDSIRDNYNSQLSRVREYGSKRAEQLWESYERQVNRMRTFSLQQRLKMMRQYKVKQRYLNKLLESFQDSSTPEEMLKHEEEVRAALEMPDMPPIAEDGPSLHLSRTSSFHSLPEFVIDEDGTIRPGPVPASTSAIRFSPRHLPSTSTARDRFRSESCSTAGPSTSSTSTATTTATSAATRPPTTNM